MAKKKSSAAAAGGIFDGEPAALPANVNGGILTLEHVGPVDEVQVPLMPGRVTLLTGSNGAGKSKTLKGINYWAGVDDSEGLSPRDGSERGRISGFGVEAHFTLKRNWRTGNLDILVVEEGFSLARFVRPPHQSAESNDKQRLKDLANVLDVRINQDALFELMGGAAVYKRIVSEKTLKEKEVSAFLASLKRDCDKAGLEDEKLAAVIEGEANTLEDTLPETTEGETDSEVLSAELAAAHNAKTDLEQKAKLAEESKRLAELARATIALGQGVTVDEAQSVLDDANGEVAECEGMIEELERGLERERQRLVELNRRKVDAERDLAEANSRRDQIAEAQQSIESAVVAPTDQDFESVERRIVAADAAYQLGVKLREAANTRAKIEEKRQEAKATAEEAARLRNVAQAVFGLLVDPINKTGCGIEVDELDRLVVVNHPIRGRCYVNDLSPGEAWQLVIKMIVKIVGAEETPAIVAIPQEALEGLDPMGLKMFVDEVAKTKLMIVTGHASATVRIGADGQETFEADHVGAKIVENWRDLMADHGVQVIEGNQSEDRK